MGKEDIAKIEFHNAVVDCRKKVDYVLDIYREMITAFEKENWESKGPEMAMQQAEKANIITSLEHKRMGEDWQEAIKEAKGLRGGTDFGVVQEKLEGTIFEMSFNCALRSVQKLEL